VPGRIGAGQSGAPYTYAWAEAKVCKDFCTPMDQPYQNDGYKACGGLNHVITVWRNFDPSTNYKICNRVSGKCLDSGTGISEGSAIVQNTYGSKPGQKWKIVQINPKQYKVVNVLSGKVLSVYQKKTADGTAIVQTAYASGTGQLWSFTSMANSSGFHAISPLSQTTSVLSLPSASATGNNQAVQEWKWTSANHMQWSIGLAN
jgi:hypothetical protein